MNRRKLLSWLTLSGISGLLSVVIGACTKQGSNQEIAIPKTETSQNGFFKVGNLEDLDETGRLLKTLEGDKKVLVVRDANQSETLYALNPTCTHQGCPVDLGEDSKDIFCPCHGSTYKADGTVIKGPASRPLENYQVKVEGNAIWVNPTVA
ncbi:MAG: Rieske (2Fe-2S) protein [Acaryochloris sp. RU_4_1]|nr:Rieske (2Fe-2S) protein [Acaryochloris sp. RU_4_1]